ncbi:unnamed protein product [Phytophthora lilii]|uniref:Unnamed protein product n=1 Tax=Phytophthora lilii TaxID=2077276 RepID=A0A9W6UFD6_9STRA|nr:unnamed protein product [Phytophthora lilii]
MMEIVVAHGFCGKNFFKYAVVIGNNDISSWFELLSSLKVISSTQVLVRPPHQDQQPESNFFNTGLTKTCVEEITFRLLSNSNHDEMSLLPITTAYLKKFFPQNPCATTISIIRVVNDDHP